MAPRKSSYEYDSTYTTLVHGAVYQTTRWERRWFICCGLTWPLVLGPALIASLFYIVPEYQAAHGAHQYNCSGTLEIVWLVGMCADFVVVGQGAPRIYCSGPLNSTALGAFFASETWPCWGRTAWGELGASDVVVLSRENDGAWWIALSCVFVVMLGAIFAMTVAWWRRGPR